MISRWCGFGREMQGGSAQSMYVLYPGLMGDVVKGCLGSNSGPGEHLLHHPCAQKASRTCDVVNGTETQVLQLADRKKHPLPCTLFC